MSVVKELLHSVLVDGWGNQGPEKRSGLSTISHHSFIHLLIHSFNKHLRNIFSKPDPMLWETKWWMWFHRFKKKKKKPRLSGAGTPPEFFPGSCMYHSGGRVTRCAVESSWIALANLYGAWNPTKHHSFQFNLSLWASDSYFASQDQMKQHL